MGALAKAAADLHPERMKPELLPHTANLLPDDTESLLIQADLGGGVVQLYSSLPEALRGRPLAGCVCMPGPCCLCVCEHLEEPLFSSSLSPLPLGQQDSQICRLALCWLQQVLQKLISSSVSALCSVWLGAGLPGSLPPRLALLC